MTEPNWGPTGKTVFERTYARVKPDGTRETWGDTVRRVAEGNLSLVYGPPEGWDHAVQDEYRRLVEGMEEFKILPAGRHLWASGVPGRQYLFNCHVAGWGDRLSEHFEFTFMRLMEGGGVGSNYSSTNLEQYGAPRRTLRVHVVCDPSHPDYANMADAGLLSSDYSHEWTGAFPAEDSREGWSAALVDLIDTYMTDDLVRHEDRVYDVSRVRAEGQPLRTFGGTASGPLPLARLLANTGTILNGAAERAEANNYGFEDEHLTPLEAMAIDHEIGACVVAGGNRRSARMSIVRWDDPYIFEFINCKTDPSRHWTTNVSVEIDTEFLDHLKQIEGGAPLRGKRAKALEVHRAVVTGMLTNGEPGYWHSTLSNEGEPTPVVCTNPCGEIALTEWENCNLGHVNMDAFALVDYENMTAARRNDHWESLREAHRLMTRFLIRATFGDVNDPRQAAVLAKQRRIGVGHFGVQGFLAKSGIRYSDAPGTGWMRALLSTLRHEVREEARRYAFDLRIPEPVKVTTVAPTGTIAKLAGRTEGIHPVYARRFIRRVRFSSTDLAQSVEVERLRALGHVVERDRMAANTWVVEFPTVESLVSEVEALGIPGEIIESADEIPLERMLAFQSLYQTEYADNAVSFTVNVPAEPHQSAAMAAGLDVPPPTAERVNRVMGELAKWLPSLKGTTLMIDGSRPQAPMERLTDDQWDEITSPVSVADSVDEECSNGACPVR